MGMLALIQPGQQRFRPPLISIYKNPPAAIPIVTWRPCFRSIEREVCGKHRVTRALLWSRSQAKRVVNARHEVWVRCRNETGLSYPVIARCSSVRGGGDFDWSTIIKAVRKYERVTGARL